MKRGNLSHPAPSFVVKPVTFAAPARITNSSSRELLKTTHQSIRAGAEDASRPKIRSIS